MQITEVSEEIKSFATVVGTNAWFVIIQLLAQQNFGGQMEVQSEPLQLPAETHADRDRHGKLKTERFYLFLLWGNSAHIVYPWWCIKTCNITIGDKEEFEVGDTLLVCIKFCYLKFFQASLLERDVVLAKYFGTI